MRHVRNYMIEKSQGNAQTNKEKEHSKISKCAERREKILCIKDQERKKM